MMNPTLRTTTNNNNNNNGEHSQRTIMMMRMVNEEHGGGGDDDDEASSPPRSVARPSYHKHSSAAKIIIDQNDHHLMDGRIVFKCTLNEDQCLSLDDILRSFQTAINEEQAWALCYQIVKCCRHYYQPTSHDCYLITDPSHVLIHKDGHVHQKTLYQKTIQGTCRTLAKSSHKLLTSLGIVLFHALDYGLCEDEERTLSKPLELLIERLTTAHELASRARRKQRRLRKRLKRKQDAKQNINNKTSMTTTTTTTSTKSTKETNPTNSTKASSSIIGVQPSSSSTTSSNHHQQPQQNNANKPSSQHQQISNDQQMNSIGSICYEDDVEEEIDDERLVIGVDHPDVDIDEDVMDDDEQDDDDDEDDDDDDDDDQDDDQDDDDDDDDECANADEGIERDCHEYGETNSQHSQSPSFNRHSSFNDHHHKPQLLNFDKVMQMCVSRLSSRESADNHYKAVCRALLAETLELSTFLDQIAKGTKELRKSSVLTIESNINNDSEATLEKLQFHDWARLWIQVIRELRHGVKLKKVDQEDLIHNTEYELTPYEMLLDDIRSRRYKLNKVMVNGDLPPRVKKDAHELILDFIRSRPPLVPVSQRVLKPAPPKQVTLYEKLMESIRQEHKLRPTPKPTKTYSFSAHVTPIHHATGGEQAIINKNTTDHLNNEKQTEIRPTSIRRKKIIKANIQLDLSLDDDDDDVEDNERDDHQEIMFPMSSNRTKTHNNRRSTPRPMSAYFPSEMDFNYLDDLDLIPSNDDKQNFKENGQNNDSVSVANLQTNNTEHNSNKAILRLKKLSSQLFSSSKERRHSISVCDLKTLELDQKAHEDDMIEDLDFNEDARNHVAAIWEQSNFGKSLECLSLTLKEVQHIRSVLTKAEIESLGVTKTLKKDLENGKICFTCLKTKFTFWGPWATICKLCNRAICDRCSTKMHIPKEQFDHVPIYMLSPTPSPPNERHVHDIFKFTNNNNNKTKQQPTTKSTDVDNNDNNESKSLPPKLNQSKNRMINIVRMLTINKDQDAQQHGQEDQEDHHHPNHYHHSSSNGPLVKVCRDCKILVRHLVDIGHTNFGSTNLQRTDERKHIQHQTAIKTN